jgi:ATP-dependent DNA helicase RecG
MVWGIRDDTHEVVGTHFKPNQAKKGNEALTSWLLRLLTPQVNFRFFQFEYERKRVALLEVPRAPDRPVQFQGVEFIRVGSYRKKLKDHPQLERELWRLFDSMPFESQIAAEHLDGPKVLALLDYPGYFEIMDLSLPSGRAQILARLADERMIVRNDGGSWNVTNLGAILFGRDLSRFTKLARKAARVIVYEGKGRLTTVRERAEQRGYASGFSGLMDYLDTLLPRNEVVEKALRTEVPMYPAEAVRELVANALIHQDFALTGAGPMIEIFEDRMEITNPGQPLVSTDRFLDSAPRSRNELLASFMRRVGVCEERGSGVDKVVFQTEFYQLPAPLFEATDDATRVTLFGHKPLKRMDRRDRVRACYLHACLRFVGRDPMTNSSLRARFGIEEHNSATASRIIHDALEDEWVKAYDPDQSKKFAKYVPFWA